MRDPDPNSLDELGEVGLVVEVRHDDLGRAGARGHGRGARAAVVHDGGHAREERQSSKTTSM